MTRPSEAQDLFLNAVPELKMTSTAHEFARLGMGVQRFSVLSGSADAKAGTAAAARTSNQHASAPVASLRSPAVH